MLRSGDIVVRRVDNGGVNTFSYHSETFHCRGRVAVDDSLSGANMRRFVTFDDALCEKKEPGIRMASKVALTLVAFAKEKKARQYRVVTASRSGKLIKRDAAEIRLILSR